MFARHQGAPLTLMAGILFVIISHTAASATLKKTLSNYGVDRFALFPSLESLAAHIEWLQSRGY